MTNNVHLLLTPRKAAAIPTLLMSLGRRYVQYINRTYKRTGTLWDSRYKSSSVQSYGDSLPCTAFYRVQGPGDKAVWKELKGTGSNFL